MLTNIDSIVLGLLIAAFLAHIISLVLSKLFSGKLATNSDEIRFVPSEKLDRQAQGLTTKQIDEEIIVTPEETISAYY